MRIGHGTRRVLKWVGNGLLVVMLRVDAGALLLDGRDVAQEGQGDLRLRGDADPAAADARRNYRRLFTTTPFVKYFRNSTIIALGTTLASLVCGCSGAYALARLRFPGAA